MPSRPTAPHVSGPRLPPSPPPPPPPPLLPLPLLEGSELVLGLAAASEPPCTPASAVSVSTASLPEICAVDAEVAAAADAGEPGAVLFSPLVVRVDVLEHPDDEMWAATMRLCVGVGRFKQRADVFNALATRSGGGRARDTAANASRAAIALSQIADSRLLPHILT